jgi:hypothetical protein
MQRILILIVLISVCVSASGLQAERAPTTFVLARHIKKLEPAWRYIGGVCTCPPLVPGQVWRDEGSWERKDKRGRREAVNVEIVKAASPEETADWMRRVGAKSSGCRVESYALGDEGYLKTCPRSFKSALNYRKDRFLVTVNGDSRTLVERFAKYSLYALPAN